jgi:hypothetical protein
MKFTDKQTELIKIVFEWATREKVQQIERCEHEELPHTANVLRKQIGQYSEVIQLIKINIGDDK